MPPSSPMYTIRILDSTTVLHSSTGACRHWAFPRRRNRAPSFSSTSPLPPMAESCSPSSSSITTAPTGSTLPGEGGGMPAERKGRFRVKQVEAGEVEEASYPEGDIVGGRIKASERSHVHTHDTSPSSSPHPYTSHRMGTVDMSTVSDLTDSLSKSGKTGGEKKGRFTIRELPDLGMEGSGPSAHHPPGTPSPHVHMDPHPHVHQSHGHHQQGHRAEHPPSHQGGLGGASSHGLPHSRPPPHPHGHHHMHGHSLPRASSAQQLEAPYAVGGSGGTNLRPATSMQHMEGIGHGSQSEIANYRAQGEGQSGSGRPYAPGLPPAYSQEAGSPQDQAGWRLLRQQNDLILHRLSQMERFFHSSPHLPGASGGVAAGGPDRAGFGPASTPGPPKSSPVHHHEMPPSSMSSSGPGKDIGAGKLTYLLEQMKVEVEAAVSRRKEVDLQMKRLQEKNRALEEKVEEERRKRVETEKKYEKVKERCESMMQELDHRRGAEAGGRARAYRVSSRRGTWRRRRAPRLRPHHQHSRNTSTCSGSSRLPCRTNPRSAPGPAPPRPPPTRTCSRMTSYRNLRLPPSARPSPSPASPGESQASRTVCTTASPPP
ncbi:hypothetical protein Naga_100248g3 [Nannochloropsis gaditana]|uniref:Uncharacterized protein n=1 Tax=Nannochloropsis gaditana TaxID=72520 RepID=W7TW48_9STRA|nr:hypothetical protein Naga_100248g3 [Nannochloropsis gaditana]